MSQVFENLKAALADHYAIEREIGSGGMATVYLAHDVKHERNVALKVLRPELAAALGPDRFVREIRIAAKLTHPHILPLHDSGEADGFLYYVMPYIDGESLRQRLERQGELPVHEAAKILAEVVDALSYAHAQGIVHRDIKPDNVLMSGHHALVTDFGVAKAVSEATGRQELTTAGVALGTPSYMSPEQAAAAPHIDHRTDIYAVGALAYELLAGRAPFEGATPQAILAAHVMEPPDPITKHRPAVSQGMADLVMKCLEKKPGDRWQTSAEMLPVLQSLGTPSGGTTPIHTQPMHAAVSWNRRKVVGGAAVVTVSAMALTFGLGLWGGESPLLSLGPPTQVTRDLGLELDPAVSPDGRTVAYSAGPTDRMRLYVRQSAGGGTIALTEDFPGHHRSPQWSPDASQIAFQSDGSIWTVPAFGGTPRSVASPGEDGIPDGFLDNPAWSPDGNRIAFVWKEQALSFSVRQNTVFYVKHLETQAVEEVIEVFEGHSLRWSPDGTKLAFVAGAALFVFGRRDLGNVDPSSIGIVSFETKERVNVIDDANLNLSPEWMPDGRTMLFVSNREGSRDVYQVSLDGEGRPTNDPRRVTTSLDAHTINLSADGSLLSYTVFSHIANIWSLPIPTQPTSIIAATPVTHERQVVETADLSSDGQWLLYDSNREGNQDIFRISIDGGQPEPLTTNPFDDYDPKWSPDGTEIVFYSLRTGNRDLFLMNQNGRDVQQLTTNPEQDRNASWSSDGNSLVFTSNRTGRNELYRLSRTDGSSAWSEAEQLTTDGGFWPRWSASTGQIVYRGGVSSIRTLDPTTGESQTVISGDLETVRPEWSVDGSTVYFGSYSDDDVFGMWGVPAAGGTPRELVRFDDPIRGQASGNFSVAGDRFLFFINEFESDVWVVELGENQ